MGRRIGKVVASEVVDTVLVVELRDAFSNLATGTIAFMVATETTRRRQLLQTGQWMDGTPDGLLEWASTVKGDYIFHVQVCAHRSFCQ